QNAAHFVERERDSKGLAESINMSRLRREENATTSQNNEQQQTFEAFERSLKELYGSYTFEFAAKESGVDAKTIEEIAKLLATAGTKLSSHNWRSVTSGVSH